MSDQSSLRDRAPEGFEVLVDLNRIHRNAKQLQSYASPAEVMVMLKADAYGVGAVPLARQLDDCGLRYIGAYGVSEARSLDSVVTDTPVMNLAPPVSSSIHELQDRRITQAVHTDRDVSMLESSLSEEEPPLRVHLNVDTGLHRDGVPVSDAPDVAGRLAALELVELEGIYTTLVETEDRDRKQFERFTRVHKQLEKDDIQIPLRHMITSAGLRYGDLFLDMVRPGFTVLGYCPYSVPELSLEPAVEIRSNVLRVAEVDRGEAVGYDGAFVAPEPMTVATIEGGYAEGIPRSLSGGSVICNNVQHQVVGKVSCNHTIIDVSDASNQVRAGDTVYFVKNNEMPLLRFAEQCDVSPYTFLCDLSARAHRYYLRNDQPTTVRTVQNIYRRTQA